MGPLLARMAASHCEQEGQVEPQRQGDPFVLKNIGSNWVLNIYIVVVTLIQGPYMVDMLGAEGDGVWRLVLGATALLNLLVMGVPMASVRFFSEHLAGEDKKSLNQAISSCIGLYLFLGVTAAAVGAIFYIPFGMGLERAIAEET